MPRNHTKAYRDLLTTGDGRRHLEIIATAFAFSDRRGPGWTLSEIMRYVSQSMGGEPCDAWLTLNALEQLWLLGRVRSVETESICPGAFIEMWRAA